MVSCDVITMNRNIKNKIKYGLFKTIVKRHHTTLITKKKKIDSMTFLSHLMRDNPRRILLFT